MDEDSCEVDQRYLLLQLSPGGGADTIDLHHSWRLMMRPKGYVVCT